MKFGVLKNIAGNIEALRDADRRFDELGVDAKVCLGQIVGIYPYVDDCVEFLITRKYLVIRQLIDDEFVGGCQFVGWSKSDLIEAVKFSHSRVSTNSLTFLHQLPRKIEINGVAFEGLTKSGGFLYEPKQVTAAFTSWRHSIVIHAAESDPYVWHENLTHTPLSTGHNQLDSDGRLLISTGGVGSLYEGSLNTRQPAAIVFNDEERSVHLLRPMCDARRMFDQLQKMNYPLRSLAFVERREYEVWRNWSVGSA